MVLAKRGDDDSIAIVVRISSFLFCCTGKKEKQDHINVNCSLYAFRFRRDVCIGHNCVETVSRL
jgi:hypothetical protein